MERLFFAAGAASGFVSVAAGAFGAHALRMRLAPDLMAVFETAVKYQLAHALALLACGLAVGRAAGPAAVVAGILFLLGTLFFSGSLYALALLGVRALGVLTPVGGVAFLAGWAALFFAALAMPRR